ncbi:MAG: RcnB family protein [Hyphomonadaceae bacterium]
MKRLMISAVASLLVAGTAVLPAAADPPRHAKAYGHNDARRDYREDRRDLNHARREVRRDVRQFHRGEYLRYYPNNYYVVDYRHRHLAPPPRGYRYVENDNGDLVLAAIATGLIAAIIASQ